MSHVTCRIVKVVILVSRRLAAHPESSRRGTRRCRAKTNQDDPGPCTIRYRARASQDDGI